MTWLLFLVLILILIVFLPLLAKSTRERRLEQPDLLMGGALENAASSPNGYCKPLILTFSPGEKEPLSRPMTETREVAASSSSLPLGETHAPAAVRAVSRHPARLGRVSLRHGRMNHHQFGYIFRGQQTD
jgi:hypothetical protein